MFLQKNPQQSYLGWFEAMFSKLWEAATFIVALKNFAKFTAKHLCWYHFLNNLATYKPVTIGKRLLRRFLLVNLANFFGTIFLFNICERSLLVWEKWKVSQEVLSFRKYVFRSLFFVDSKWTLLTGSQLGPGISRVGLGMSITEWFVVPQNEGIHILDHEPIKWVNL